jgi:hypothetical protein
MLRCNASAACTMPRRRVPRWPRRSEAFDTFNIDLMYALARPDAGASCAPSWTRRCPSRRRTCRSTTSRSRPTPPLPLKPPELPDGDLASDMLDLIVASTAEAGLQRYEVSAFAQAGAPLCRHNLNYWEFGDYLGIGAGAHGKLRGVLPWLARAETT